MNEGNKITFSPCEEVKCIQISTCISMEGCLLKIPVYLYDVCPCKTVIVGVRVYKNNRFYAMRTKEVFTGRSPYCKPIEKLYIGEMCFLLIDGCTCDIDTEVLAHYIY